MMKITAGIGSIDEYETYAKEGVSEMFAGYVPQRWMELGGRTRSLNRREVMYYNVQLGSRSELEILSDMMSCYKKPVSIAMNSLSYAPQQYPMILDIMEECMDCGFFSFIIADMTLLLYLEGLEKEKREKLEIHLSGECGEISTEMLKRWKTFPISRVIFHRKTRIGDMKAIIQKQRQTAVPLEFEAFALNELCHYNGAYCNSIHCDELCPSCKIPYILENQNKQIKSAEEETGVEESSTGSSGCGLCALWKLRDAGVSVLKLVSRGNYTEDTLSDIRCLRRSLQILENAGSEREFIHLMKRELFPEGCSHTCYYL